MTRLRKFLRLSPAERRLLVMATLLLGTIRLRLWLLPYPTLQRILASATERSADLREPSHFSAAMIGWAVAVAGRYVPKATCLTQALTAQVLLARAGHPARLRIGVARGGLGQLRAHAWVESQDRIVVGGLSRGGFTPLLTSQGERP